MEYVLSTKGDMAKLEYKLVHNLRIQKILPLSKRRLVTQHEVACACSLSPCAQKRSVGESYSIMVCRPTSQNIISPSPDSPSASRGLTNLVKTFDRMPLTCRLTTNQTRLNGVQKRSSVRRCLWPVDKEKVARMLVAMQSDL